MRRRYAHHHQTDGFAMIELVVSAGIFVILSILIFSFFRFGTRSFQQANAKQGIQVDALRVMESLQAELKRSSIASVDHLHGYDNGRTVTSVEGTVNRDAISFVTLDNWKDKTDGVNFDLKTQVPLWNTYMVFYATKEEIGRLIRLRVSPNPPPHGTVRFARSQFLNIIEDDPESNHFDGKIPPYVALAKNVLEFQVITNDDTDGAHLGRGEVEISIKLKQKHQQRPNSSEPAREFDYYELRVNSRPENSYPNNL